VRAVVVKQFGGPDALVTVDVPVQAPGPGEVRIRVGAAGINPADVLVRVGVMVQYGSTLPREQYGVGTDVAGTVEEVGEGVRGFAVGDAVIGLQERLDLSVGGYAEQIVLEEWAVAPAPAGASMAEAATLPLNALTADQALDKLALTPGEWLLVTGAAGGVGGLAVELAVGRGIRVIAQAGADDEALADSVRALVPGGVHGAIDAANQGIAASDAVRHGGAFVSLLNSAPQGRREVRMYNHAYHTDGARLAELSALAGAGRLSLRVAETFPLDDAPKAHEILARGGVRGRLVLVP